MPFEWIIEDEQKNERLPAGPGTFTWEAWQEELLDPAGQYLPVHLRTAAGRAIWVALADLKSCTASGCRRLARIAGHQIDLLVPEANGIYRRFLLPPRGGLCGAVGWVSPVEER